MTSIDMDYVVERADDPVYWVRREGQKQSASAIFSTPEEACAKAREVAERDQKTTFVMRDYGLVSRIYVFHPGEAGPCPNRDHDW